MMTMRTRIPFSFGPTEVDGAATVLGTGEGDYDAYICYGRGFEMMLLELGNANAAALSSLILEVKSMGNEIGDWVPLITDSAWNSPGVAVPLQWTTGRMDTINNTTYLAGIRLFGAYAFRFKAGVASVLSNGGFTGNADDWTPGVGWLYGTDNVAATTASTALNQALADMSTAWTDGEEYLVTFTITGYSAGSLVVGTNTDTDQGGAAIAANGTYTRRVTADAHADGLVFTGTGFTGVIDSVSAVPLVTIAARGTLL